MKTFFSYLAGILTAIVGMSAIYLLSGNNFAFQFGGEGNTIEQGTLPRVQTTPTSAPQHMPQSQVPAPTPAPTVTSTQAPVTTTTTPTTSQTEQEPVEMSWVLWSW